MKTYYSSFRRRRKLRYKKDGEEGALCAHMSHTHTRTHARTHTHTHTRTQTHTHTHMHTRTCTHARTHTHNIHTHATYTHSPGQELVFFCMLQKTSSFPSVLLRKPISAALTDLSNSTNQPFAGKRLIDSIQSYSICTYIHVC